MVSSPGFPCTKNKDTDILKQVKQRPPIWLESWEKVTRGAAEAIGFVQSKEKKVKERCYCCLLQPSKKVQRKGVRLFWDVHSDETRGNGCKLQLGKI